MTTRPSSSPLVWTLTSGIAGCDVIVRGVAQALGWRTRARTIRATRLSRCLAPWAGVERRQWQQFLGEPPPQLLLSIGRHTVPYARAFKRHFGARLFVAVMQNPRLAPRHFDLVWAPAHDRVRGANVLSTLTSPHDLRAGDLQDQARALKARLPADFPTRRLGVLVGGPNGSYRFAEREAAALADALRHQARAGWGLCIMFSARTPDFLPPLFKQILRGAPAIFGGPHEADNPYRGVLGLADRFLVTPDSVNMMGEAAFTGRPIHLARLRGGTAKFHRFHAQLVACGAARWFEGRLENWSYSPLNSTEEIAAQIRRALSARHPSPHATDMEQP